MKFISIYIKKRFRWFLAQIIFCAVFAVSFFLYHLTLEAVLYPILICVVFGLLIIGVDIYFVYRKHKRLTEISKLPASMISSLPEIESVEDLDYQKIIGSLINEIEKLSHEAFVKYHDMTDYYTVWVHQIKTPITSMRLTLQNEDTPFSRKLTSDLFQIEQYVEMVLAFMRLDSDSGDYVFKEYGIDGIIKQSLSKFASEFIDRKIRLEYEPIDKIVVTDEKWLTFVIEQLLSNALKYTRRGSVKIFMSDEKTLCIKDTGIGIAPEDLPRIFEKGYTGYNGRKDKKASGLGLYLCKKACRKLEIEIRAESVLDEGTAFYLDLEQYNLKSD